MFKVGDIVFLKSHNLKIGNEYRILRFREENIVACAVTCERYVTVFEESKIELKEIYPCYKKEKNDRF